MHQIIVKTFCCTDKLQMGACTLHQCLHIRHKVFGITMKIGLQHKVTTSIGKHVGKGTNVITLDALLASPPGRSRRSSHGALGQAAPGVTAPSCQGGHCPLMALCRSPACWGSCPGIALGLKPHAVGGSCHGRLLPPLHLAFKVCNEPAHMWRCARLLQVSFGEAQQCSKTYKCTDRLKQMSMQAGTVVCVCLD